MYKLKTSIAVNGDSTISESTYLCHRRNKVSKYDSINTLAQSRTKVTPKSHSDVALLESQILYLPSTNLLHITVSKISPKQDLKGQGHYGGVKSQIKVTLQRYTSPPPTNFPTKY